MSSASCASRVERILSQIDGVEHVTVNFVDFTAKISYNNKLITPLKMNKILSEVGYGLTDVTNSLRLKRIKI